MRTISLPGDGTPDEHDNASEFLNITWHFITQASPQVRAELAAFLTQQGWHPRAGLSAYLDSIQFTAYANTTKTTDSEALRWGPTAS